MFTGIITHLGKLVKKEKAVFTFMTDHSLLKQLDKGTSISVNGVCLTVLQKPTADTFSVDVMPETEKKSNMSSLKQQDLVNLELPATLNTFLSGHIVQGHVDTTGEIIDITKEGNSYLFTFSLKPEMMNYIIEKGSIAINGISLTVIKTSNNSFSVGIIPHTHKNTMLHTTKPGDTVNVEVDVLAKYLEKLTKR